MSWPRKRKIPTQVRVKELLLYDDTTGIFYWRIARAGKSAGSQAGYVGKLYVEIGVDNVVYLAHQLAWLYKTGVWPRKIDHRDTNGLNNRWLNLRLATNAQNLQNSKKRVHKQKPCSSKYKGVFWSKENKKWCAQICIDKRHTHLGYFFSEYEAHAAYCTAAKKHFGEFARAA